MADPATFLGAPITDDDATIARALEDVSIPALLCSLVHLTGDTSILEGELRPVGNYLNEIQGFMDLESQAAVRAMALERIIEYRDAGCPTPPRPSDETILAMMRFIVAEEVPAEYLPMMLEELGLAAEDDTDRIERLGRELPDDARADAHTVVIGGGMSGLLAAIRLHQAGIPFTVIEKNDGVGGVWFENRYPGCRVDVGNHFYCYSFEPSDHWSEFFAQSAELRSYFDDVLHRHEIVDRFRFGTEVERAEFDDATGRWSVHTVAADGTRDELDARFVISAVGQLNRPKAPDIDGLDSFAGPVVHTAAWDETLDLGGRQVAVIGTGASAFQLVPAIADDAAAVRVFQRTAPWMFENPHYHDQVGPGMRWALHHLPFYGRWFRFLLFWPACDGGLVAMKIDPEYPHQDRAISEVNDAAREVFTAYIVEQCGDDEELAAKVVPDYVCLGKRTLQDNGSWLRALRRDDVELVTTPIERIDADGVITSDGRHHRADVIVTATGFHANRYLWPMHITGRDGTVLRDVWGDEPTALYGMTVPGFPNLFCMYGPGTNLAHGGSLIFHSECQIRYILGCIAATLDGGHATIECRTAAHDEYNERLQAELDTMVWSHPSIKHSWYRNDAGKIFILSPWRLFDYWQWTREPDLADFRFGD